MRIFSEKLTRIKDDLPPAVYRLIEAIFKIASQSEVDEAEWSAKKNKVLEALESSEGKVPTGEIIRQRLQSFKKAIEGNPDWKNDDQPLIKIQSTKVSFKITTDESFLKGR